MFGAPRILSTRALSLALAALCATILASGAHASAIAFNDFGSGNSYGGGGVTINSIFTQGSQFTSLATGEVSEILAAVTPGTAPVGSSFTLSFYADNSNFPGTLLGSFVGSAVASGSVADILTPGSGVNLTTGQKYWLIASSSNDLAWHSNDQSVFGNTYYHDGFGTTFVANNSTLQAFEVIVPEPSSMTLAGAGILICVAALRWRAGGR